MSDVFVFVWFTSLSKIISRSIIFPFHCWRRKLMVLNNLHKFTQLLSRRARIWTKGLFDSRALSKDTQPPPIRKARLFNLSQLMEESLCSHSSLPRSKPIPVDNSTLGINNKFTCCLHSEILLIKCQKVQVIGSYWKGRNQKSFWGFSNYFDSLSVNLSHILSILSRSAREVSFKLIFSWQVVSVINWRTQKSFP